MFLYRLKTEFSENLRLLVIYGACLVSTVCFELSSWFNTQDSYHRSDLSTLISGLSAMGVCGIALLIVVTMFKRDDLKSPQDFSATRPIRPLAFYGAKLAFIWLAVALPVGLATAIVGLTTGQGMHALIGGLELFCWFGFIGSLLALSCMNYAGGTRSFLIALAFFGGAILTVMIIHSNFVPAKVHLLVVDSETAMRNLLIALVALTVVVLGLCVRQLKDKHRKQQPWWFAAGGMLTALFITYASLSQATSNKVTVISKVTEATVKDGEIYTGHAREARFIQGGIGLAPIPGLVGDGLVFSHQAITFDTPGFDKRWFEVQLESYHSMDYTGDGPVAWATRLNATRLNLSYKVYDREPGNHSGYSASGADRDIHEVIDALPKRKIRITGTIGAKRQKYSELHRSPLSKGFSLGRDGYQIRHIPADMDSMQEDCISWKQFNTGFATSQNRGRRLDFRYKVTHPSMKRPVDLNQFASSGYGTDGVFGRHMSNEFNLSESAISNCSFWHQLTQDKDFKLTPLEWKKDAVLITEVAGDVEKLEIPVDFEVELPDPEVLHEMLKERKL